VLASTDYQVIWAGDCAGTTGNRCSISLSGRRGSRSGTFTVVHMPTGEQRSMRKSSHFTSRAVPFPWKKTRPSSPAR
jgi:hypothetical protein